MERSASMFKYDGKFINDKMKKVKKREEKLKNNSKYNKSIKQKRL